MLKDLKQNYKMVQAAYNNGFCVVGYQYPVNVLIKDCRRDLELEYLFNLE